MGLLQAQQKVECLLTSSRCYCEGESKGLSNVLFATVRSTR